MSSLKCGCCFVVVVVFSFIFYSRRTQGLIKIRFQNGSGWPGGGVFFLGLVWVNQVMCVLMCLWCVCMFVCVYGVGVGGGGGGA